MKPVLAGAVAALVLTSLAVTKTPAQEVDGITPPATLSPQGQELALAGCGSRDTLFMDLYAVALYLPEGEDTRTAARDSQTPKAVRLYASYGGELPDEMPWNDRLAERLTQQQMQKVEDAFRHMTTDDTATIAFAPGQGTTIAIAGETVATSDGPGLMDGVLDLWLGSGNDVDLLPDC